MPALAPLVETCPTRSPLLRLDWHKLCLILVKAAVPLKSGPGLDGLSLAREINWLISLTIAE